MESKEINELGQHLKVVQNQVIGLFRPRFYPADQYIPVVENRDGLLTCIEVGALLGLQTLHIDATSGRYVEFPKTQPAYDRVEPKAQTLSDMMKDPLKFHQWYKDNVWSGK
jgi:alkaline phosphatase